MPLSAPPDVGTTVSSAEIENDSIVNADIKSDAAIAYSKLNLGSSIVNADIAAGAAIAASKLASDVATQAELDAVNAANAGAYRHIVAKTGRFNGGVSDGTQPYALVSATASVNNLILFQGIESFYVDPADYAVSGLTTKYRIRASILTNNTDPGSQTFTVGLYNLTAVGGASIIGTTPNTTAISGSLASFVNLAATSFNQADSGDFTPPAAGYYQLGLKIPSALATNAELGVQAQLQYRNV